MFSHNGMWFCNIESTGWSTGNGWFMKKITAPLVLKVYKIVICEMNKVTIFHLNKKYTLIIFRLEIAVTLITNTNFLTFTLPPNNFTLITTV